MRKNSSGFLKERTDYTYIGLALMIFCLFFFQEKVENGSRSNLVFHSLAIDFFLSSVHFLF